VESKEREHWVGCGREWRKKKMMKINEGRRNVRMKERKKNVRSWSVHLGWARRTRIKKKGKKKWKWWGGWVMLSVEEKKKRKEHKKKKGEIGEGKLKSQIE
jgi:hypothetical protein